MYRLFFGSWRGKASLNAEKYRPRRPQKLRLGRTPDRQQQRRFARKSGRPRGRTRRFSD